MELQELTTNELINIDGGSLGNLLYDVFYACFRSGRFAYNLSSSLRDNPAFGDAMVYK